MAKFKKKKSKLSTSTLASTRQVTPSQVGAVGQALLIEPEQADMVMVSCHVEKIQVQSAQGFMTPVRVDANLFNKLFTSVEDLARALKSDQVEVFMMISVPRSIVGPEVLISVDNTDSNGTFYVLKDEPIEDLLNHVSRIVEVSNE